MKLYELDIQVTYEGTVKVEGEDVCDAERRVRELVRPQGVVIDEFMSEDEDCRMDMIPVVHFRHWRTVPRRPNGKENS